MHLVFLRAVCEQARNIRVCQQSFLARASDPENCRLPCASFLQTVRITESQHFVCDHQVPSAFLVIALVKAHRCAESFRIGGFPGVVTSAGRSCDPLFQQRRGTFHGTGWVKVDREWSRSQLRPAKPELSDSSSVFSFICSICYNLLQFVHDFVDIVDQAAQNSNCAVILLTRQCESQWKTGEHRRVCNRLKAKGKDKDERT